MACDYMYISRVIYLLILYINCCKVSDLQIFRTILQRYLYFISTVVRNTVSYNRWTSPLDVGDHFCGRTVARHKSAIKLVVSPRTPILYSLSSRVPGDPTNPKMPVNLKFQRFRKNVQINLTP